MKKTGLLAVLTTGALILGGCGSSSSGQTAMQIGDTKVTVGDIAVMAQSYMNYGLDFETAKNNFKDQIEETLKYGAVGEAMGLELTDEDRTGVIEAKAQYAQGGGGYSAYSDYLKKAGSSMEFLETLFTASAYQSKVMEQMETAEPTDDELKAYFADNYYRAKHILIAEETEEDTEETAAEDGAEATEAVTEEVSAEPEMSAEERANDLLARAQSGEDFDAMIAEYSEDPGSESNPDGYIFTDGDMVTEFEECVKSLQPGEFGICKSDYGYHVIQRLPFDASQANYEQWFTDNKTAVSGVYEEMQMDAQLEAYLEEYGITVTVNDDVIAAFTEDQMVTPEPTTAE